MSSKQQRKKRYQRIDRFFLVFFPIMFGLFNCGYWYAFYVNGPGYFYDQADAPNANTEA